MTDAHKNFAVTTVATPPSPATSGTSLVLATGGGALMPAASFNGTVWPAGASPTSANAEIVRVTVVSTDTLTITRAQESSSARTIVAGDQFAATITAKSLTDIESPVTVSALPTGPVDGQECSYVADATNGVVWKLKYRSASGSSYKWEFVGGAPLVNEVLTEEATTSATYADLTTVGPSVTLPLAGDYLITAASNAFAASGNTNALASVKLGSAATSHNERIQHLYTVGVTQVGQSGIGSRFFVRTALAASAVIKLQYVTLNGNSVTFGERSLSVLPVRVG